VFDLVHAPSRLHINIRVVVGSKKWSRITITQPIFSVFMQRVYILAAALLVAQVAAAIVCGPFSCEWGNEVYFYIGIACLIIAGGGPFFQSTWLVRKRVGYSLVFILISAVTWCAGFMMGGFRIICHLM
jgi:hypothetical protein